MSQKIILFFAGFLFLFSFHFAHASIIINEIMYDLEIGSDTDREWVEVYNGGAETVDFSTYKFFEANTNHSLVVVEGDKNIPAGGYAVIVQNKDKFKTDWPNFAGAIFDSSFSLGNETGEMLAIKDADLNIVDQYTYSPSSGGMGDGKSLQLLSGTWQASAPTPGTVNVSTNTENDNTNTSDENTNTSTTGSSNSGSSSNTATLKNTQTESKISVEIIGKTSGFVGLALPFKATGLDKSGNALFYGKYFWNFGDGDAKEIKVNDFNDLTHTYFYPGTYTVTLEYYTSDYVSTPEASDKFTINIVKNDILISRVGDEKDFFVELTNNTQYPIDLSKWILQTANKNFIFPKNTFILANNKLILSPKITNFNILDKNSLKLLDPQGQIVFDYYASVTPVTNITTTKNKNSVSSNTKNTNNQTINISEIDLNNFTVSALDLNQESGIISRFSSDDLGALAIKGETNSKQVLSKNNNFIYYSLFILIIVCGGGAVYFIRKKQSLKKEEGDDFDILDE